jgi:NAD+ kinase
MYNKKLLNRNKPVRNIAFSCHPAKESLPPLVQTMLNWTIKNKITSRLSPTMAKLVSMQELTFDDNYLRNQADMFVVLGGDGTILSAARDYAEYKLPIAGINLGHLGFMTLEEPRNALNALRELKAGNYDIEQRMMLRANVYREGEIVYSGIALNDVVIQKAPMLRVIKINVSISGNIINTYQGDGLIVSTPTGSTAYSLSAGGPIVPPWVNVMIVCPLNSHMLSARPVITADNEVLNCRIACVHSIVELVLDGQSNFKLLNNDLVEIVKADEIGNIVVLKKRNFFNVLRKKMNWG